MPDPSSPPVPDPEAARAARAAARRYWPVRVYRLGEEPGPDLSGVSTPAERLSWMWQLTLDTWGLTGATVEPRLPRHAARVVRGGR